MPKHDNLHAAKANKNDEFYTKYNDIANEIPHYRPHFKDKVVYCNCDDPTWSNFWIYFHNNFKSLGLKKLISTHYQKDTEPSYALIYEGGNDFNMKAGKTIEIIGNYSKNCQTFYTAGDFRSEACIELLKEADIVCTNPPFSLLRQYMAQLIEYKKKFIIIGNQNAVTYKEVFPLFKENKVWYGYTNPKEFVQPDKSIKKFGNISWFTNLDISKRHDGLWHKNGKFDNAKAHCYYEGFEDNYPKYYNFDAIDISKTKDIPIDYPGAMGVPITWLDKYNPEEFTIIGLGIANLGISIGVKPYEKEHKEYRKNIQKRGAVDGDLYLVDKENHPVVPYARILIRNRNPIKKEDDKGY